MLTLVMSTFRENSGGNLVDFSSFASTDVAILTWRGESRVRERKKGRGVNVF